MYNIFSVVVILTFVEMGGGVGGGLKRGDKETGCA